MRRWWEIPFGVRRVAWCIALVTLLTIQSGSIPMLPLAADASATVNSLTVTDPDDRAVLGNSRVFIRGTGPPNAEVRLDVRLGFDPRFFADPQGNWSYRVDLTQGRNEFDFFLQDDNTVRARLTLFHSPPTPASSPTQGPTPTPASPLALAPIESTPSDAAPSGQDGGRLEVHFIDVGQGDSTLLLGPDFTILFDAGRHDRQDVVPYLHSVGVDHLDLLIGTHPHADHIGQIPQVLIDLEVAEVWMSGDVHTTLTFERTLDAILDSDADFHEPRAGETHHFGSATLEVVNPPLLTGDLHEGSISVRVLYGSFALLLTGDAEAPTEEAMIHREHDLTANVLQLGHHGSRTSTSQVFLDAVQPELAIYSAGEDNAYGHPHEEVLALLAERDTLVYGTDIHGSIIVTTDGSSYEVLLENDGPPRGPPDATPRPTPIPTATSTPTPQPSTPTPTPTATPTPSPTPRETAERGCASGQVDINSADKQELQRIIHIGPARADDLIRLRPFTSVDALTRISGIAAARLADIKEQGVACVG